MVGLPARGKTFIAHKLCRYLNWRGYLCATASFILLSFFVNSRYNINTFNVSDYRRRRQSQVKASFFDPDNLSGQNERQQNFDGGLRDMFQFLTNGGEAAIFDGLHLLHTLWQNLSYFQVPITNRAAGNKLSSNGKTRDSRASWYPNFIYVGIFILFSFPCVVRSSHQCVDDKFVFPHVC